MDLIVILDRTNVRTATYRYLLRAAVPTARQPYFANVDTTSAYKSATQAELTALKAGEYVEVVREAPFSGMNAAQIKAWLVDAQAAFQTKVTADAGWNPWKKFGTRWDGSTWVDVVVN